MNILGIDPGTHRCGLAILSARAELRGLYSTTLYPSGTKAERLSQLWRGITEFIERYLVDPGFDVVAIESGYIGSNRKTALTLGESRGVVLVAAFAHCQRIIEIEPSLAKKCATGKGNAKKRDVQSAVAAQLGVGRFTEDEADAFAVAMAAIPEVRRLFLGYVRQS